MAKHPNKHIREALKYAEKQGWTIKKSGPRAHAWGIIFCSLGHQRMLDVDLLDPQESGVSCPGHPAHG